MSNADADADRKNAKRAYKSKDYDTAATLFAHIVEMPESSIIAAAGDRAAYASALVNLGKMDEATVQLVKAAELAPGDARVRYKLGEVLARLGRHTEAAAQFRHVVTLEPMVANNYWRLAVELNVLGEDAQAEEAVKRCLALEPEHTEAQILQLERSFTSDPERDGQAEEVEQPSSGALTPGRDEAGLAMLETRGDWSGPPQGRTPLRHRPWMIVLEAIGILAVALWLQNHLS